MRGSDIDRRRNGWDNLFRKFSVVKSWDENFVISNSDRNKTISIEIHNKTERAKK